MKKGVRCGTPFFMYLENAVLIKIQEDSPFLVCQKSKNKNCYKRAKESCLVLYFIFIKKELFNYWVQK